MLPLTGLAWLSLGCSLLSFSDNVFLVHLFDRRDERTVGTAEEQQSSARSDREKEEGRKLALLPMSTPANYR